MQTGLRSDIRISKRNGRRAPELSIVELPTEDFDFEGFVKWEHEVYASDPTGGDPARF